MSTGSTVDGWRATSAAGLWLLVAACSTSSRLPQDVDPARYEAVADAVAEQRLQQAEALLLEDRAGDALPLLRDVLEAAPEHVPTHLLYQDTCTALGGDHLAAMEAFYRDLPGDPPSSVAQYMRARLMEYDAHRLVALDALLASDPGFYFAHLSRARLLRWVGQPDRAVQSFLDALEVNDGLLEAHLELAEVLVELRRFREAEPHYADYVRGQPTDRDARLDYMRLLLYQLGRVEEAREQLLALQRDSDPDDVALLMDRAAVAWRSDQLEDAEALYRQVLELDSNQADALLNLGNLYFESLGRTAEDRRRYWPKARQAYLDYQNLGRAEGAMDLFDYHFAIPYRLEQIEKFLAADGR